MTSTEKFDAYQAVTDTIIDALEAGTVPWRKPWSSAGTLPLSLSTKKPYRGVNVLLLSLIGAQYTSPYWGTYKKISEVGGQVRKGEKSTVVTFWKKVTITEEVDGKKQRKDIFMLKTYRVFNVDQADWEEGKKPVGPTLVDHDPIAEAEAIVAGYPNSPVIHRTLSDRAYYAPGTDEITVPVIEQYATPGEFYSTLAHELTHSTGHTSRLNRPNLMTFSHFGDELYSKEELVAEMGAAFFCAHAGIEVTLDNSAAYIASWLKVLKGDKKLLIQAAAQAQKAIEHILGVVHAQQAEDADKAPQKALVAA